MVSNWKPGSEIPKHYSGMPVTFTWNEVALTLLLKALQERYPSGYPAMCDAVREAMRSFTPPKPDEPLGLGAVVEDDEGEKWVRAGISHRKADDWRCVEGHHVGYWSEWFNLNAVRVLSEGVTS